MRFADLCLFLQIPQCLLLIPQPEDSRIRRFKRAFDVTDTDEDCLEGVMGWVFDMPREKRTGEYIAEVPANTRLQKALKRFLLDGGTVTGSWGTLKSEFE